MADGRSGGSGPGRSVRELVRQPVVHFLVIGLALGVALQWFASRQDTEPDTTIRISAADIARAEAEWRSRWKRPPTQEELAGLVKARIREMVLYREAVAMGLDRDEPVIRRVLVQKLESIAKDLIELSLSPSDQDLEQYFEEHAERYRPASLITFTHVYVDPDLRGGRALEDAEQIVAELRSLGSGTDGAEEFGDPFMLQRYFPEKDLQRIASLFGAEFARLGVRSLLRSVARAPEVRLRTFMRSTCMAGPTFRFRLSARSWSGSDRTGWTTIVGGSSISTSPTWWPGTKWWSRDRRGRTDRSRTGIMRLSLRFGRTSHRPDRCHRAGRRERRGRRDLSRDTEDQGAGIGEIPRSMAGAEAASASRDPVTGAPRVMPKRRRTDPHRTPRRLVRPAAVPLQRRTLGRVHRSRISAPQRQRLDAPASRAALR